MAWSPTLFVVEPAPIVATVERLTRKGGREVVARCPGRDDAEKAAEWLVDRLSRFAPELAVTTQVEAGSGQRAVPPAAARRLTGRGPRSLERPARDPSMSVKPGWVRCRQR